MQITDFTSIFHDSMIFQILFLVSRPNPHPILSPPVRVPTPPQHAAAAAPQPRPQRRGAAARRAAKGDRDRGPGPSAEELHRWFPQLDQWEFQDPKMEVPTIYKAYFLGLCKVISPQFIWPYIWYLHFRILEFPLIGVGARGLDMVKKHTNNMESLHGIPMTTPLVGKHTCRLIMAHCWEMVGMNGGKRWWYKNAK